MNDFIEWRVCRECREPFRAEHHSAHICSNPCRTKRARRQKLDWWHNRNRAQLRRAAPEMLKALCTIRDSLTDAMADGDCNLPGLLDYVNTEIGKVEGREP